MTPTEPTLTLHLLLASGLMLFLASCGPAPTETAPPAKAVENELARTVCVIWGQSQPTWVDAGTERTKDEIDFSYRRQEATCAPIQGPQ